MKKILSYIKHRRLGYVLTTFAAYALWLAATATMSGCKKERLFTSVDSIAPVPSQFHYFNGFSNDSSLTLSVDGVPRQNVNRYTFSPYYSSSSAFNLNALQPNSKLIAAYDPFNNNLFSAMATIQFKPNTSYIVYSGGGSYDTVSYPRNTTTPGIGYLPEDTHHPYDGSASIRLLNLTGTVNGTLATITPNLGAGTSLTLNPVSGYNVTSGTNASDTYTNTQPGVKTIALKLSGNAYSGSFNALLTFLPVQLNNGKAYTLIAVGDMKNYLAGLEPRPKLFLVEDDAPATLKELVLSSLVYPGNATTTTTVNVINGAYNVPGIITYTDPAGNFTQFTKTTVYFNQTSTSVSRWPFVVSGITGIISEDVGNSGDLTPPSKLYARISSTLTLQPNAYFVRVLHGASF